MDSTGTLLKELRRRSGFSVSELARRSGVGKGTISELENDLRGARLETLFALTTALDAPLSSVLPRKDPDLAVVVEGDSVSAAFLDRWPVSGQCIEAFRATISTDVQKSLPHAECVEETVTVIHGQVVVGCVGAERVLSAGQSHRYDGDQPHRFQALDEPAEVILLMHYPEN